MLLALHLHPKDIAPRRIARQRARRVQHFLRRGAGFGGGGALVMGLAQLQGGKFTGNTTSNGNGGGLLADALQAQFTYFSNNAAMGGSIQQGGAVYLNNGPNDLDRVWFQGNEALSNGSALYATGLTTLTDDENNIGQRLREMAPYLDYISPMEYPDTYNAGMLQAMGVRGCSVPRYCPYETVYHSTLGALERAGTTKVRAWIQAYGWGTADYLQERKAAEDAPSYGYMWWNNEGIYDDRLFKR